MTSKRLLSGLILVTLAFGACSSPETGTSDPTAKPASEAPSAQQVTFGEQLAQIKGHHQVAIVLYASGDLKGAATHTGHPVDELLGAVQGEIGEHDAALGARLEPALRSVSEVVADKGTTQKLASTVGTVVALLDEAEEAVIGEPPGTAYRASVIAALLTTVGHEYEEAVQDGKVTLLAEYQDAQGFKAYAKELYGAIEDDVRKAGAEEAEEIEDDFVTLDDAIPSLEPPKDPADPADVTEAVTHIGAELAETVDAVLPNAVDPEQAFDRIDALLTEILETYEAGDGDEAAELAAEAYLENYELVEGDVIELAPAVNEDLEPILGTELRAKIKDGVEQTELEALVKRARELLDDAKKAVLDGERSEH